MQVRVSLPVADNIPMGDDDDSLKTPSDVLSNPEFDDNNDLDSDPGTPNLH